MSSVSLNGLRRQVWSLKNVFFYNRKCFFLLHFVSDRLQPPSRPGQQPGAADSLARIVVKTNLLCCKKTHFSGFKPASGVHLGCLRTFKKVFFYNRKGFFFLLLLALLKKGFFLHRKGFFLPPTPQHAGKSNCRVSTQDMQYSIRLSACSSSIAVPCRPPEDWFDPFHSI